MPSTDSATAAVQPLWPRGHEAFRGNSHADSYVSGLPFDIGKVDGVLAPFRNESFKRARFLLHSGIISDCCSWACGLRRCQSPFRVSH